MKSTIAEAGSSPLIILAARFTFVPPNTVTPSVIGLVCPRWISLAFSSDGPFRWLLMRAIKLRMHLAASKWNSHCLTIPEVSGKLTRLSVCNALCHRKSLSQLTVRRLISWVPVFSQMGFHLRILCQTACASESWEGLLGWGWHPWLHETCL